MKRYLVLLAASAALLVSAMPGEAAQITVHNGFRHTIHVTARREGHGDRQGVGTSSRRFWRGHRSHHERDRLLDLGHMHGGETRTFDVDSGQWHLSATTSHRRTETAEVRLHTHQRAIVRFQ